MYRLKTTVFTVLLIAALLILAGCNALQRGDIGRFVDDELAFSSIGFLMTDGSNGSLLYRNAVTKVHGTDTYIEITIPYFTDQAGTTPLVPQTGSELTLTFETVAKDAEVFESNDLVNSISPGVDSFTFHDGSYPLTRDFIIRKTDSNGDVNERTFTISVVKSFYPVVELISNPSFSAPPDYPAAIAVHFEDELGNEIPFGTPLDTLDSADQIWLSDGDGIDEESSKKNITADFTSWDTATVTDTGLAPARPLTLGNFWLTVPESSAYFYFEDENGYPSGLKEDTFKTAWNPDAVYMAAWGDTIANGATGTKTDPVDNLTDALSLTGTAYSRWEIRVAEGKYDLGSGETIDEDVSIYGGYKTDFSSQYDMEDEDVRLAHGSIFTGIPTAGSDFDSMGGVLTYNPGTTINTSSILYGIVIQAADADNGGGDYTTALKITGNASPTIRFCTLTGGGGGALTFFSGAALVNVTSGASPTFQWNTISAGKAADGANAGLYSYGSTTFFTATNNTIGGVQSTGGSSHGVYQYMSGCELGYNTISSAQASSDSIGIYSNQSTSFLLYGNRISSAVAGDESTGILSVNIPASSSAHIYKNAITSGSGDSSYGFYILNASSADYEIMNNAVSVGGGTTNANGIYLYNASNPNTFYVFNNLFDSSDADFAGITTFIDITGDSFYLIECNAFDDGDHSIDMDLSGGTVATLWDTQESNDYLLGNITKSFAFNSGGYVTSGMDANLAYGGYRTSSYSTDAQNYNAYDWNGDSRTSGYTANFDWSIGPYEIDSISFPSAICVTMPTSTNPGSDKYVLGTAQYPFATVERAYTKITNWGVSPWEIRVAVGTYTFDSSITMNTDVTFRGGWNQNFTSRSNTAYSTILTGAVTPLLALENTAVTEDFLMEGLTFESTYTGNAVLLDITNYACPVIRNNTFDGSGVTPTQSTLLTIDSYSCPTINNNTFKGGSPSGDDFCIDISNLSYPSFNNNIITGGTPAGASIAIRILSYSYPYFNNNEIHGGSPTGTGDSLCMSFDTSGYSVVEYNDIYSGTPASGAVVMIQTNNSSTPIIRDNDLTGNSITGNFTGINILNSAVPVIDSNTITTGDSAADICGILGTTSSAYTISNNIITTGAAGSTNTNYGISLSNNSTAPPTISGNEITLGSGINVYGLYTNSVESAVIEGNSISGGNATTACYGMYLDSSTSSTITNSDIDIDGDGCSLSCGLYLASNYLTINNNEISGGTGQIAYGLNSSSVSYLILTDNIITGTAAGSASTTISYGCYFPDGNYVCTIIQNTIHGGEATTNSYGIYVLPNTLHIVNNLIHGGGPVSGTSCGIHIYAPAASGYWSTIYNNTIYAGRSSGMSIGINMNSDDYYTRFKNNLIVAGNHSGSYGIYQSNAYAPYEFLENIILGTGSNSIAYRDYNSNNYLTADDINTYLTGEGKTCSFACIADTSANLTDEHPSDYLVSFTANGGITEFLSDNWHLITGGTQNATTGGVSLQTDSSGAYSFDNDRDGGSSRTDPWSIGAYEY